MVKTRNDFNLFDGLSLVDAIKKAKEEKYNGKDLEDSEKVIFDSALLKEKDASGSEKIKLDDFKDTAALLDNLKKTQVELPNEKKNTDKNLSAEGALLLDALLTERRNKTIAYRVIDEKKSDEISKIIKEYQVLQYRRVNRRLEAEKKLALTSLSSIRTKSEKQDKKVEKALEEFQEVSEEGKRLGYKNLLEEAEGLKLRGENIVNALKDDIDKTKGAHDGYNILKSGINTQKKVADVIYRKDSSALVPATESWGSIIETSVANPYSDKKFTHPTYLADGLPWQMKELFKQFDKDKLFFLIDGKFSNDPAKSKKIKTAYENVVGSYVLPDSKDFLPEKYTSDSNFAPDPYPGDYSMVGLEGLEIPGVEMVEDSEVLVPPNEEASRKWNLFVSDVLYFMHAFFPKGSDFSNNEFLKPNVLPFTNNTNTISSKHDIYWRGRENNTLDGKARYRDYDSSAYPREKAFPSTKLQLSWAGAEGESIPEFFWQVYDKPEAIQFNGSKKVLDKNGVAKEFFKDDISVYEEKLISWKIGSNLDPFLMAYRERVKDIISGKIKIGAHVVEEFKVGDSSSKGLDGEKYWTIFEKVCHKILTHVHRSFHEFRKAAEAIDYHDILTNKKELIVPYMIEGTKSDIDNDIVRIWEEMGQVFDAKVDNAKRLRAVWADELDKRTRLNAQEVDEKRKLSKLESLYKVIEDGKFDQLKAQLDKLGGKLVAAVPDSITSQEAMAMHSLYWVIKEHEGEASAVLAPYTAYMTTLAAWEKARGGNLPKYTSWKKQGRNFAKRLSNWKKNEGRNLDEKAIAAFFDVIKLELLNEEKASKLSQEEKADLVAIENYLEKDKEIRLRATQLEIIFAIDDTISQELTSEWNNFGDEKKFKEDSEEVKRIADMINNLTDKGPFFDELKTYLTDKSGVPNFPGDSATEQDKLNYFFTLKPEYVIGAAAAYHIKHDSTKKKEIEDEMTLAKNDQSKVLDLTKYGNGQEFTEAGIILYYYEKLGGLNHSYAKQGTKTTPTSKEGFWRTNNLAAWLSGVGLLLLIGALGWAIHKRKTLLQWWNAPSELEEELDEDEEED